MDDNNIPTPPKDLPTGDQGNADEKDESLGEDIQGAEKIFDISPDLNISPVEDGVVVPFENKIPETPPPIPLPPIPPAVPKPLPKVPELKEPLFSFKGHDIRTGQKEEIPAGPMIQAQKLAEAVGSIADTKPASVASIPPTAPTPPTSQSSIPIGPNSSLKPTPQVQKSPTKPVQTPPVIKIISTATAPNSPVRNSGEILSPLRTYEGDVAEVLAHKNTSTASIAIAESQRNTGEERLGDTGETSKTGKKIIIAVASLLLVVGGVIGAYYLYSISPLAPAPRIVETPAAPSIMTSDTRVAIPIDGINPTGIIYSVRTEMAKPQTANSVKEIIPVQTKSGQHFRVDGQDMINILDIGAPDILSRSLAENWMLGIYADANGAKTLFVIATVDYFQNAFAGMLQWESVMADDLKQYFYQNTPSDITTVTQDTATASTSALVSTSTPVLTPSYVVLHGAFMDRVIKNKDVREFVTSNGEVLFLYSFIDNKRLVVAGSEAVLAAILNRLEQQTFVR